MSNPTPDTNKTSIGNVQARDHAINQFLKNKPEGVAEISVNYTDPAGSVRQQKVDQSGQVSTPKLTKTSDKAYSNALDVIKQHSCTKSTVSFTGICSQERWDSIFGKKDEKKTEEQDKA